MADIHTFFGTCREFCRMVRKIVIYPIEDDKNMDPRQTSVLAAAPDPDPKANL